MNGKRLLFVDDEQSIRVTLSIILEQKGFDVSVAANVREAIQKINDHTFDALLSDLNIDQPGDGFAVVRAMRQVNPQCVVVILTGYPAFESAVEGIHQQVDDYLTKPADIDMLVGVLKQKISERKSPPQPA
jgi:DNA-binding NtrC family response regulator